MATGLYPHHTGVWQNMEHTLPPETPTWMQAIRRAGYRTSLFGKTHLNAAKGDVRTVEHLLRGQGIDDIDETVGPRGCARTLSNMTAEWDRLGLWEAYRADYDERFSNVPHVVRPSTLGVEHYYDTYVGQESKTYIEQYDRDQPWFCWVSFGGPHEPWDTPEPYASKYPAEGMPKPIGSNLQSAHRVRGDLDVVLDERSDISLNEIAEMRANYAGNVSLIDDQIGEMFATIEARGEWDNTVVVLVSDHGEMNGDYGLIYKHNFLNSAARVPLLIRGPGIDAGRVCDSPVEWFDVGPTLTEYAGGELDFKQFAKQLQPCLEDETVWIRDEALCEHRHELMITDEKWKMAVNREGHSYLLFNLEEDPDELKNLAGLDDYRDTETELRLRMFERVLEAQ